VSFSRPPEPSAPASSGSPRAAGYYASPAVSRGRVFDVDVSGKLTSYALPYIPWYRANPGHFAAYHAPWARDKPDLPTG